MNYKDEFQKIRSTLEHSSLWLEMTICVENSPWHREANTAVHTDMVVAEYYARAPHEWSINDFAGALAVLFHDVGKPTAKIEKFSEARGTYYAFHGHEKISARKFVDYVMGSEHLTELMKRNPNLLFITAWMIEYHLPWDIKDQSKRERLFATLDKFVSGPNVFVNVVLADAYGRTSDDEETKRSKSMDWAKQFVLDFNEWKAAEEFHPTPADIQYAAVLIGASGSGKTRYFKNVLARFAHARMTFPDVFSLDRFRHKLYGDDYAVAFNESINDKEFKNKANAEFFSVLKSAQGKIFVIDNVHASKKSRAMYVTEASKRGFRTVGVVFMTSLGTVLDRQTTRSDKHVPYDAVTRQYMSVEMPSLGEFDEIEVFFGE